MIAIIDYGMGNLRSVQKAFEFLGFTAKITSSAKTLKDASHIVLPGVGAIADAMKSLIQKNLDKEIYRQTKAGKPFLGICLGMQLLLNNSLENGNHPCLGLVEGTVKPFKLDNPSLKIPHMGWNSINFEDCTLFNGLPQNSYVYFVHSYHAAEVAQHNIAATCNYGGDFVCGVVNDNIYGLQFHPEKSGAVGQTILKNFGGLK